MQTQNTPVKTKPLIDQGIAYNILVESPSQTNTPLQIVCFFDFGKNQHYQGGTEAVNQHFAGEIDNLRKNGVFKGDFLETLLIIPRLSQIPAQKLLLIGLGDPLSLSFELLEQVGYCALLEAQKLQINSFCFAPSLKDAGLSMPEGLAVSNALPQGMSRAVAAATMLAQQNLGNDITIREIFLLAGEAQANHAYQGLLQAFGN